jgi:hypothetical protein
VSRCSESVEPNLFPLADNRQRTPADEPGTEQRCQRDIATELTERESKTRIRNRCGRKAAVARKSREYRVIAEIFTMSQTIGTNPAGVAEPGNADPLTEAQRFDAGADRIDPADHLMTGNDRIFRVGQLAIQNMQVCPTDTASQHLDPDLARSRLPVRQVSPYERSSWLVQYHRLHGRVLYGEN